MSLLKYITYVHIFVHGSGKKNLKISEIGPVSIVYNNYNRCIENLKFVMINKLLLR